MKIETADEFIIRKKQQFEKVKIELEERIKNREKIPKRLLIGMKDIGRKTNVYFAREAWTLMRQSNLDKKIFVIERLRKFEGDKSKIAYAESWKSGDIEYRISYWIVGQIGNRENKWTFGSFCPLIPKKDFDKLINKAKKERTII